MLYGSSGITLKVFVQSLPLKDTYTRAISYQWHRGRFTSSNTVFMAALSRITKENKNQDKARRVKMDAASFSLAPSPWNRQNQSSLSWLHFGCPFCHMQNNSISGRTWMPYLSLNSLLSNGHWRRDRVQTFTAKEAFVNRAMNRQKENNWNSHWFGVFIHPLPQFSFFFFFSWKANYMAIHQGILAESGNSGLVIIHVILAI